MRAHRTTPRIDNSTLPNHCPRCDDLGIALWEFHGGVVEAAPCPDCEQGQLKQQLWHSDPRRYGYLVSMPGTAAVL